MQILSGKKLSESIKENIKSINKKLISLKITPTLAIIRIGNNKDDMLYEKSIIKFFKNLDLNTKSYEIEENTTTKEVIDLINQLNENNEINGIILLRPIPKHLDEDLIRQSISHKKDIDCLNTLNLGHIMEYKDQWFMPCTALAVIEILKFYNINLMSADVILVGSSLTVGRPLSMMLLKEKSTVVVCNSKTQNLKEKTLNSDIVISSLGKAKFLDASYFKEGQVIIDVGINFDENGKLCGDVDINSIDENLNISITPVPGGVGSVTTAILAKQLIKATMMQNNLKIN